MSHSLDLDARPPPPPPPHTHLQMHPLHRLADGRAEVLAVLKGGSHLLCVWGEVWGGVSVVGAGGTHSN